MNTTHLQNIKYGDLVMDALDRKPARFVGMTGDGFVELMDLETGNVMPDLRHPSQVMLPHWR